MISPVLANDQVSTKPSSHLQGGLHGAFIIETSNERLDIPMKKQIATLAALASIVFSLPAAAQAVHGDWESFQKDGKCWASTVPAGSEGSVSRRSAPYLSIQNHPAEGVRGSVLISAGFEEAGLGEAKVEVDGKSFEVLPYGGAAFAASGKPEAALIAAMRRGAELKVTWTSKSGETATDRYSLAGFTASKNDIDSICR